MSETKVKTKHCENFCPKCNSEDIKWHCKEFGDVIYQPGTCRACGCEFREYYAYAETKYQNH